MSQCASSFMRWLRTSGLVVSRSVERAFRESSRADFVLPKDAHAAFGNHALPIGYWQTISQPTTVALMLELLRVMPWDRVLDIGSGSWWTTALLSSLTGEFGSVIGLEIIPELVIFGKTNLEKCAITNAIIFQARDGVIGMPSELSIKEFPGFAFSYLRKSAVTEYVPGRLAAFAVISGNDR